MPGVRVPTLDWTDAGDGYQEATALVPYDYAEPGGRTFSLHLVRLAATDPAHRIGSLFLNYGGPGDGAAENLRTSGAALMPPEVLARYDLVGVDPRGTGQSQPVHCTGSPAEQQSLPYAMRLDFPTTPAEESVALDQVTRYAAECRARNGDLLDHIGTLAFARDLDVLRAALGDERINLLGLSYGTFLGQVVAATFPDRTGALVLDSVVDPAWVSDTPGTISTTRMNSDIGSWETLQQFFRQCAQAGPQGCPFATDGDPQERFAELAARLRTAPLQVPLPDRPPLALGYDNLVTVSEGLLEQAVQWPALGQLLHATMAGDAPAVAEVLEQVLPSATEYSTYFDAQAAIVCADTDNPRDPAATAPSGGSGTPRSRRTSGPGGPPWPGSARIGRAVPPSATTARGSPAPAPRCCC